MSGYAGEILKVDLPSRQIAIIPTKYYSDKFLGGRGIAAKMYWDEVAPEVKPFDAKSPLIFALGPLAGLPVAKSSHAEWASLTGLISFAVILC